MRTPSDGESPWKREPMCPALEQPRGAGCKPCLGTWVCGGWREEFKTTQGLRDEMKKDPQPPKEWESSRSRFIQMSNEGRVPAQLRACDPKELDQKRNKWQKELQDLRLTRKRLLKKQGHRTSIKSKLNVMTEQRYKETHKGRTPTEDGIRMKMRKVDGKLQLTCLVRKKQQQANGT